MYRFSGCRSVRRHMPHSTKRYHNTTMRRKDMRQQIQSCVYYSCVISILVIVCIVASTLEDETKLRKKLFSDYNPDIRPVYNQSTVTVVDISFNLQSIQDLDQRSQVLRTSGHLTVRWTDELLRWNPSDYGGLVDILVRPGQIWTPDLILDNGANGFSSIGGENFLVDVDYQGQLLWTPGDVHETQCLIDVTFYPFDTQTCYLKISPWMHTDSKVSLTARMSSINLTVYMESGEFRIIDTLVYNTTVLFDSSPFSFCIVRLALERRSLFYIINTILPILLLSILNALVFIIPPEAGEKMSLSITVLLAYAVFLSIVSEDMPDTSLSVSLLAVYIILVLALGTASIVVSAIVLHLHHKVPNTRDLLPCFKRDPTNMRKPALLDDHESQNTSPDRDMCNRKNSSLQKLKHQPDHILGGKDEQYYKDLVNKIDIVSFWVILLLTVSGFLIVVIFLSAGG